MAVCGCHYTEAVDAFDQYSHMSARLEEQQEMTRAAEKLATEVSSAPFSQGGGVCSEDCPYSHEVECVLGKCAEE